MAKRRVTVDADATASAAEGGQDEQSLGDYLTLVRKVKKMTLREVQEATDSQVSNAYLSQLETGKITRPSPNVLHALARVYSIPYDVLMEKAGYLAPPAQTGVLRSAQRPAARGALAGEQLSKEEEEKLLEYLAFLRGRTSRKD